MAARVGERYSRGMSVTVREVAESLRRREAERRERAERRAERIRGRLDRAKGVLESEYGARRVTLFGSFATGAVNESSDVDLAVEGLDRARYFDALADVTHALGVAVDLVRLEDAPASLRERIEAEGRPL